MFTGIVAELGIVKGIQRSSQAGVLTIAASQVLSDGNVGDSVAIDGVCLTITDLTHDEFHGRCFCRDVTAHNVGIPQAGRFGQS